MNILVINSGSSSIKYKLIEINGPSVLAEGLIERIGEPVSNVAHRSLPGTPNVLKVVEKSVIPDHSRGMNCILSLLTDPKIGVIKDLSAISAIGHRVVQGGEKFKAPVLIDGAVVEEIKAHIPLAPLHNPGALAGITTALKLFDQLPQVAVFDTAFHQTIPAKAFRYAVPHRFYQKNGVRRFGFHGTSHQYVTRCAAQMLDKPVETINLISLHLGNGSSVTAVEGGKSVDTSMGMTPLDGVIMGTRCGALDPAVIAHLVEQESQPLPEIMRILTRESGLKGLCGSNDLRDIHDLIALGDENAVLALDMLIHSYRHFLGAYFTVLSRVDAVVFTAGVGENDPAVREGVCRGLEHMGVIFDIRKNLSLKRGKGGVISSDKSPVKVMVIPTNEELEIAVQVRRITQGLYPFH